ncbi:hypothetical protein RB195_023656 [Necator americanus]|uniref:Uncharacterized protein n=1 Tax=Necator americanus TaxID=51031 RepID=A0ABR1EKZ4_NECAM
MLKSPIVNDAVERGATRLSSIQEARLSTSDADLRITRNDPFEHHFPEVGDWGRVYESDYSLLAVARYILDATEHLSIRYGHAQAE